MIQEKKGVSTDELKLKFAGRLLHNRRTLSDYNIQDGATITIGRMGVHVHVPLMLYHTSYCPLQNEYQSVSPALILCHIIIYWPQFGKGHHKHAVCRDSVFLRSTVIAVAHLRGFQ